MKQSDIIQINTRDKDRIGSLTRSFTFLGSIERINSCEEFFNETIQKRIKAYNLVPDGAIVIPAQLVPLFRGWFIGGVLEDSLYRVYGICHDRGGITGYSCSVYWVLTKEEMDNITVDMRKVHGDFDIKTKNYEEMIDEPAT